MTRRPAWTARVMVLRATPRRAANLARVSVLGVREVVISEAPVDVVDVQCDVRGFFFVTL